MQMDTGQNSKSCRDRQRLPWVDFLQTGGGAHLVAAVVSSTRGPGHMYSLGKLLQRLILEQEPASAYASGIVRLTEVAEIHCGFANKADADRFAAIVRARRMPPLDGWASYRSFRLDAAKEMALAGALRMPGKREPA
jgi:hypothetical protein